MISVGIDRSASKLQINFQYPLPLAAEAHPEWAGLQELLAGPGRAEFQRREGRVSGLSLSFQGFRDFLTAALSGAALDFQRQYFEDLIRSDRGQPLAGLQVNFHQKPFDTPERFWLFYLNQGNFTLYFLNRFNWDTGPTERLVGAFPFHVDLETASTCNMNCPMCYRDQMEKTGQMEWEVFTKAVDECAQRQVFSLRLSWRGEALTHPRIKEMIAYATARIPNVSFLTNSFYLNDEMADCFIRDRVSYIAVSFDGIGGIYEAVRAPAKFEDSRGKLARLLELRNAAGSTLPQVRLCTIWPAIKDDPQAYYQAMAPVSDYLVTNPYMNYRGPMKLKEGFVCQYPWERLVVAFDGAVQCCTGWEAKDIILGNLKEHGLAELWASPRMENIRRLQEAGRRMDLDSCAVCRHGSEGDPNASMSQILDRGW